MQALSPSSPASTTEQVSGFNEIMDCTAAAIVRAGQLLDVVPGRDSAGPCAWFAARSEQWRARIEWATLDLSGPYRAVFDTMLPDATQVADPFHLVKLANTKLDEVRRRVQNDTLGHRGRNTDPLYRCRRLLTRADERVDRSDEQPHQTRETRGVRPQAFPQLPDPHPALRGKPSWHLLPTITPR